MELALLAGRLLAVKIICSSVSRPSLVENW
jgi:hypothetical protein